MLCWKRVDDSKSCEDRSLEALRCEFATLGGAWPASLLSSADKILAALDGVMALVSVFGASSDSASLTVLSSSGPDAFVVVPGRVLPTPWQAVAPSNKESCAEPKGSTMGPTNPHTTLIWQSGSQQTLPYEWHQLLGQTRFAESLALSAALEPIVLYSKRCELVGALLVVSYAGELPCNRIPISPSTTAPFESPGTWHGGEVLGVAGAGLWLRRFRQRWQRSWPLGRSGGKSGACGGTAPAGPSPRLLQSLAGVLGQSALAPHWPAVSRICDATQSIAAASSLPEFASLLSSAITESLAADLHVTFSVRVAIVPPLFGSHGFFLPSEASSSQLPSTPSACPLLLGANGANGLLKRAASHGVLPGIATGTSSRVLQAARSVSGRDGSFSGQSPASTSYAFLPLNCQPVAGRAATPFALRSALLLQVLRPAMRTEHASTHASTHAGSMNTYQTDEPTVRHMVATKATASPLFVRQHSCDTWMFPTVEAPSPVAREARDVLMSSYGTGVSCSSNNVIRAGCGGGGGSAGTAASAVTGVVISNVAALMQDVERPASDVAALLMSQKSKRVTSSGRVSNGRGGSASVPPPSCLVVVAGAIMLRSGSLAAAVTAAAAAAAVNGSVHFARRRKSSAVHTGITEDWVKTLEASLRGGMVDMSMRGAYAGGSVAGGSAYAGGSVTGGGAYAGGSVAGGGAYAGGSVKAGSCGPAVAVYLSSSDRLPATLLRAAKDRAAILLELLLPVCAAAIIMGPIRADLDALASSLFAAAYGSGGGNGAVIHGSRRGAAAMFTAANASVATAASSGAASPTLAPSGGHSLFSSATHVSASQITLPAPTSPIAPTSPLNTDASLRFTIRHPSVGTAAAPGAATSLRSAPIQRTNNSGPQSPRTPLSALPSSAGKGPDARDHDVFLLAQAKWPDGSPTFNPNAVPSAAWPPPSCPSSPPAPTSACTAIDPLTSSVVRISPSISSAASGAAQAALASLLASVEVHWGTWGSAEGGGGHAGMGDDLVTSMRGNLEVWVDSFWAMLRDPTAGGARGAMAGSYADDDLRYLRLQWQLGSGGAASVYAGMLLGMEVAVKVINPPPEVDLDELVAATAGDTTAAVAALGGAVGGGGEYAVVEGAGGEGAETERRAGLASALRAAQMRELVRSARECAVMSSLSHPAIVQVYSYHTRVRVNPAEGPEGLPRLLPVPPGEMNEGAEGEFHSVLIMERCDLGSLADALDNGLFKRAIISAASAAESPLPSNTTPQQPTSQPYPAASPAGSSAPSPQPSRRSLPNNAVQPTGGFSFASPPGSTPAGGAGSGGSGGAAMRAIHLTLLELALGLRHLHALNLVHCDVKVANLLLKSSASDPRGFTCKLSDFGLVNLLRPEEEGEVDGGGEEGEGRKGQAGEEGDAHTQREGRQRKAGAGGSGGGSSKEGGARLFMKNMDAAGTVTHLSPECFTPSSRLDASVDVYAFGIVMWEVFTRKPPYAEYAPDFEGLPAAVMAGLRPRFPSHCPAPYKALAHACWCADPARRPTAANIVHYLQQMLEGGLPQPHAQVCGRG